jgi:carbon monoxide dehydrogenase subunit G
MELTHTFDVSVPPAEAWAVLTDLERVAPCLPGAQLTEVEGDEFRGTVKVKVGPITAQYRGTATFSELDQADGRAVLSASGRDTKGQGNASATVTAVLTEAATGTNVMLTTELKISGKVAQFGRGVMADVSAKLMEQFVHNLEETVLGPTIADEREGVGESTSVAPPTTTDPTPTPGPRRIDSPEATPIDLVSAAGSTPLGRAVPLVAAATAVLVALVLCRCRCRSRR